MQVWVNKGPKQSLVQVLPLKQRSFLHLKIIEGGSLPLAGCHKY